MTRVKCGTLVATTVFGLEEYESCKITVQRNYYEAIINELAETKDYKEVID